MKSLAFLHAALLVLIWCAATVIAEEHEGGDADVEEEAVAVRFVNEFPDMQIELFWEGHSEGERRTEGVIRPRGGFLDVTTYVGHEFSYDVHGVRHFVVTPETNELGQRFAILAGDGEGFLVTCEIDHEEEMYLDMIDILVKPYWAPRGASRFLELVREGYYNGVALNRVVPQFLTQFGIGKDYEQRMRWEAEHIPDDFDHKVQFEPGFVSFAGSGPNSRTTEIFIVMPGTHPAQLDYFGENSWETPFALVQGDFANGGLSRIFSYGDMPPWGEGPDSSRIYEVDGYDYLAKNFPKLDYISVCYIVHEKNMNDESAGEL